MDFKCNQRIHLGFAHPAGPLKTRILKTREFGVLEFLAWQFTGFSWFSEAKTFPDPPREAQGAQEGPRWVPRGSLGSPGGGPRGSQGTPGAPQGRPGEPQGSPKVTQKLPKAPPRGENGARNAPKIDFQAEFGAEPHSKAIFD